MIGAVAVLVPSIAAAGELACLQATYDSRSLQEFLDGFVRDRRIVPEIFLVRSIGYRKGDVVVSSVTFLLFLFDTVAADGGWRRDPLATLAGHMTMRIVDAVVAKPRTVTRTIGISTGTGILQFRRIGIVGRGVIAGDESANRNLNTVHHATRPHRAATVALTRPARECRLIAVRGAGLSLGARTPCWRGSRE